MTADSWLALGDVRIRYRKAGQGAPVLVLHGWGASIEAVRMIFEDLAQRYEAIVLDFPGHGQSPQPDKPWTVSDYRDLVLALMDKLGVAQAHIVAHSFGGRVSIKLAAAHPERVGRLLMTGAAGVPPAPTPKRRVKLALAGIAKRIKGMLGEGPISRWLETQWIRFVGSADYARATGIMRATLVNVITEDLTPLLPKVKSKTLLIWGDRDQETPLSIGRVMERLIPDCRLVIYEGGGHFTYSEQYAKFRLQMFEFLGS